jgi:4-diphosphocytidyl-2-C-methyl-D-erythritol kinase
MRAPLENNKSSYERWPLHNPNPPVASGLGGGSSDAATTLLSLNELFGRPFSKKRLSEMATSLGSDVPFFILKSTAIVTGRGEKVRPVDINLAFWYLILSLPIRVSTSEVYSSWKLTKLGNKTEIPKAKEILRSLENDLEDFAIRSFPDIALAKEMLKEVGAKKAIMTGSGGAVFGVFLTKKDACFAREKLNLPKDWKVFLVKGL